MTPAEQIISIVFNTAEKLGVHLMLVGAAARDFWLNHFQVRANVRTTCDVDLACLVSDWNEYRRLIDTLVKNSELQTDARGIRHRLWLADQISVDIVPFGGVENESGTFAWPPDFQRTVNVQGFTAAFTDAQEAVFGQANIRIIKPCWLALLKLNAYIDNQERTKDLKDLYILADNYLELIDADKLVYAPDAPDADILSDPDFDVLIGGAKLISKHCRRSCTQATTAIQQHVRNFNADGRMTDIFAIQNHITPDKAQAILDALLRP